MVLRLEQWTQDPQEAWRRVQSFLRLEQVAAISFDTINEARRSRSALLSRAYRGPSKPITAVARGLKTVGVDTRRIARFLKRLNEPERGERLTELPLDSKWAEIFEKDKSEMERLVAQHEQAKRADGHS